MPGKLALSDAWMEVWPFNMYGHDLPLGIVFVPLKDHSASRWVYAWQAYRLLIDHVSF